MKRTNAFMTHLVTKPVESVDNIATGQKMRQLRKAAGLSIQSVAEKLGVKKQYLGDLELGRRAWSEKRAAQFIEALK